MPEQAVAADDAEPPERHAAEEVDHLGRAGEHGLAAALAEPRARIVGQRQVGPEARVDRGLGEADREAAARDVVDERALRRGAPEELDERRLRLEVEPRRATFDLSPARLILGPGERDRRGAGEQDHVAVAPAPRHEPHVLEQADAADDRRRVDRPPVGLVVERDVAGDDRDAQRLAGLRHPLDRLGELPGDLALLGVAEVEAVGQPDRLGAGAGDVPRRLEHSERAARAGPQPSHAALAVERDCEPAVAGTEAEDRRVEAGTPHGPGADEVVVATEDPLAAAQVRRAEQLE